MIRYIKYLYLSIVFTFLLTNFFYAQSDMCGVTSEPIIIWKSSILELFGLIQSESSKDRSFDIKVHGFSMATDTMLLDTSTEPFNMIEVLSAPEETFLDFKDLIIIENGIRDYIFKLGGRAPFFKDINKDFIKKFNKIFDNPDLLIKIKLDEKAVMKYKDVLNLVYNVNNLDKLAITYINRGVVVNVFEKEVINNICKTSKDKDISSRCGKASINVNKKIYNKLVEKYRECPKKKTDILKYLKNMGNVFLEKSGNYLDRIENALHRLEVALEGGGIDKEKKHIVYTKDVRVLRYLGNIIESLNKNKTDSINNIKSRQRNIFETIGISKVSGETLKLNYSDELMKEIFSKEIDQVFLNIQDIQNQAVLDIAQSDITKLTRKYVKLSQIIYANIILIGYTDEDKNSIISLLGEACERQCSNVPSICWYF